MLFLFTTGRSELPLHMHSIAHQAWHAASTPRNSSMRLYRASQTQLINHSRIHRCN